MYVRKLSSKGRVTITAENILLNFYETDGAEDMRKMKAQVRIDATGVEEGER
jgi:hypothetical protein